MAAFVFTARDQAGQTQNGVMEAASANLVAGQLRERGWLVLRVQEQLDSNSKPGSSSLERVLLTPRAVQVELSLRQIAVMLRGGISLLSAMQTLVEESDNKAIRYVYRNIIELVQAGKPFSDAMESQPGFPIYIVRLIRVGERTGIQETVLVQGAEMMRSRREVIRQIITALVYPLVVLLSAGGATVFMVTSLIPKLTKMLESLGKPLPAMTQSLVTISRFVETWGPTVLGVSFLLLVAFIVGYLIPASRLVIDRISLRLPIIGKIFRLSGTLTFSQTLGTLVNSGVTVLDGLGTVQEMHANTYLASVVQRARDSIIRGNNLAGSLREKKAYMPLLATMTAVGEESGNLDEVLSEVTDFYSAQLSAMIQKLSALATPAIIITVGSMVGYVYIAFFLGTFAVAG